MNRKHNPMVSLAALLLLATILVWICAGCSPALTEGEVYEKVFEPAETFVQIVPIVISNGKTYTTVCVPYTYHFPDRWVIKIREPQADGSYLTEKFYVTKEVYDATPIGSQFVYDESRDLLEEPYTKEEADTETTQEVAGRG